jgi:hypothetical protein
LCADRFGDVTMVVIGGIRNLACRAASRTISWTSVERVSGETGHCPEPDSVWIIFSASCDLVHLLCACSCCRRGVHGDDQRWSSIMPIIFDVLYREFCRARLAEMRKQLLLWPGTPVVPQPTFESGRPDNAADITSGSSQKSDSPAESPFRGVCRPLNV